MEKGLRVLVALLVAAILALVAAIQLSGGDHSRRNPSNENTAQALRPNIKLHIWCDQQVAELLVPGDRKMIGKAVAIRVGNYRNGACDIAFRPAPGTSAIYFWVDRFLRVHARRYQPGQAFTAVAVDGTTTVVLIQSEGLPPGALVADNNPLSSIRKEDIFGA